MQKMTASEMMARMGFPVTETGPYVSELRALMERKAAEGRTACSGGTWADECYERDEETGFITGYKISHEERAKALLGIEWAIDNGHSHRVKALDPPIYWRYSGFGPISSRGRLAIRWRMLLPWVGDRFREAAMNWRVWRGGTNPYNDAH